MNTTDLKPGDLVRHPEKGTGYVLSSLSITGHGRRVVYATTPSALGYAIDPDLTGWERVETLPPGHVAVRVDDLEPGEDGLDEIEVRAHGAWIRWVAQREPTQPDEPTEFGSRITASDGTRWVRVSDGRDGWYWEDGYGYNLDWDELAELGPITIEWDGDTLPMCDDCPQQP